MTRWRQGTVMCLNSIILNINKSIYIPTPTLSKKKKDPDPLHFLMSQRNSWRHKDFIRSWHLSSWSVGRKKKKGWLEDQEEAKWERRFWTDLKKEVKEYKWGICLHLLGLSPAPVLSLALGTAVCLIRSVRAAMVKGFDGYCRSTYKKGKKKNQWLSDINTESFTWI